RVLLLPALVFCWKEWHTATARPSVASRNSGVSLKLSNVCNMAATCSLLALPLPVTDCLILRGEYSNIGISRLNAAAIATPWARPSLSISCMFLTYIGVYQVIHAVFDYSINVTTLVI